jgi:hypothetical protein
MNGATCMRGGRAASHALAGLILGLICILCSAKAPAAEYSWYTSIGEHCVLWDWADWECIDSDLVNYAHVTVHDATTAAQVVLLETDATFYAPGGTLYGDDSENPVVDNQATWGALVFLWSQNVGSCTAAASFHIDFEWWTFLEDLFPYMEAEWG